jgi:flavin reductase (DIM6/NTAB) family NADH-FMN oxidoreductase RutF
MTTEFDRQRRRVLWALPSGLYLLGSRFGDAVNLMAANLVLQVCLEPKLVAAAIEAESVTADLVSKSGAFTVSLLARTDTEWCVASSSRCTRSSGPTTAR